MSRKEQINRVIKKIRNEVTNFLNLNFVTLSPAKKVRGRVLISYMIEPFLLKRGQSLSTIHSNNWECQQIANIFLEYGFKVDIINWNNRHFVPKYNYDYFIDIHNNIERLAPFLKNSVKILHITGAHWLFQNNAEYTRLLQLQQRRGITLSPRRQVPPSLGIENADYATILGNQFTISTFDYANKPIVPIPVTSTYSQAFAVEKDFEKCKRQYLWLGSYGMVHKGLDLVLEAFAKMPDYYLTVCGPVEREKDFDKAFHTELYKTSNIHTTGWIDINSQQFKTIMNNSIGIIYPSCSEGQAGVVVNCMHGGLIPIISYQSGIDVQDFGIILKENTIEEIKNTVQFLSNLPPQELKTRAYNTWQFARNNNSQEKFAEAYRHFVTHNLGVSTN